MLDNETTLADLRARFPRNGRVAWIGLRPTSRAAIQVVDSVLLIADAGIERAPIGWYKSHIQSHITICTYGWDSDRVPA